MMDSINTEAFWIGMPGIPQNAVIMLRYKKEFQLQDVQKNYYIQITADSRYRLFVNGVMVANGPCRTVEGRRYIDSVDIASFLQRGENTVEVIVAHYDNERLDAAEYIGGPASVVATPFAVLYISDEHGLLNTNESWLVGIETGYEFVWLNNPRSQLCFTEKVNTTLTPEFVNAMVMRSLSMFSEYGSTAYFKELLPRPIPMPFLREETFDMLMRSSDNEIFLPITRETIKIPLNFSGFCELANYSYTTAYIKLRVKGKAKIKTLCAESYFQNIDGKYRKTVRNLCDTDSALIGLTDQALFDGEGEYITFDYRAFRFVRFEFETGESGAEISLSYIRTGYPLEIVSEFSCEDKRYEKLWQMSIDTLKNCMFETYMDCPFYEQLQYVMDTYLQVVYTACISSDMRLGLKAIDDFYYSISQEGDMPCCAPARYRQYIWGFPIFWIFMLEEYCSVANDYTAAKQYFWGVSRVLDRLWQAVSPDTGLVTVTEGWSFVDWAEGWMRGTPVENGQPHTIYSMMLVAALNVASRLAEKCEIPLKSYFEGKAQSLKEALIHMAFDKAENLYSDVAGRKQFSMHAQIWAVLSGCVERKQSGDFLLEALKKPLTEVSYCYMYFVFRAFEKAGIYSYTEILWSKLLSEQEKGLTTMPEDCLEQRSDCHAWSAVALCEFTKKALGISFTDGVITVKPEMDWLGDRHGKVVILEDIVSLSYKKDGDVLSLIAESKKKHNWKVMLCGKAFSIFSNRERIEINIKIK